MHLSSITTHTGLSLVRKLLSFGQTLVAFDITGALIKLSNTPEIGYETAQTLQQDQATKRAMEQCIPIEPANKPENDPDNEQIDDIVIITSD